MSECRCALCVEDEVAFATRELRDRVEQAQRWARAWKALAKRDGSWWYRQGESAGVSAEWANVVAFIKSRELLALGLRHGQDKETRDALLEEANVYDDLIARIERGEHEREGGGGG